MPLSETIAKCNDQTGRSPILPTRAELVILEDRLTCEWRLETIGEQVLLCLAAGSRTSFSGFWLRTRRRWETGDHPINTENFYLMERHVDETPRSGFRSRGLRGLANLCFLLSIETPAVCQSSSNWVTGSGPASSRQESPNYSMSLQKVERQTPFPHTM